MAFRALVPIALSDGRETWCRGFHDGLPVWRHGDAPAGLVTRSQLAEQRLRRRYRQDPEGLLIYRWHGNRPQFAELFRIDLALLSRPLTEARKASIAAMQRAHRTCRDCGCEQAKCLPTSTWRCDDCLLSTDDWGGPASAEPVSWRDDVRCAA